MKATVSQRYRQCPNCQSDIARKAYAKDTAVCLHCRKDICRYCSDMLRCKDCMATSRDFRKPQSWPLPLRVAFMLCALMFVLPVAFATGWNTTNAQQNLAIYIPFENVSALGENNAHVIDRSNLGSQEHNGTVVSTAEVFPILDGRFGKAFRGSGQSGGIQFNNSGVDDDTYITGGEEFTIAIWVRIENQSTVRSIVSKRSTNGYQLQTGPNATFRWRIDEGANIYDTYSTGTFSNDRWYHLIAGRNATHHVLYIDGVLNSTTAQASTASLAASDPLVLFNIDTYIEQLNATLDNFCFWERSLKAQEVAAFYASASGSCLGDNDSIATIPETPFNITVPGLSAQPAGNNGSSTLAAYMNQDTFNVSFTTTVSGSFILWNVSGNYSTLQALGGLPCTVTGGTTHLCVWDQPMNFQGNQTFYVAGNSTLGNQTVNGSNAFIINRDTVAPSVSGAIDRNATLNSTLSYTVTLADDFLYSYNFSCTDQNATGNIGGTTSYLLNLTHTITQNISCSYSVKDGHTARQLPAAFSFIANNSRTVRIRPDVTTEYTFASTDASIVITPEKLTDRVIFHIHDNDRTVGTRSYTFTWDAGGDYFPQSPWPGHIISGDTWFDMAGSQLTSVFNNNGVWELTVSSTQRDFTLHSVGALNEVTGSYELTAVEVQPVWGVLPPAECPSDTFGILRYGMLFIICAAIWYAGRKIAKFPLVEMLAGFGFIALSFPLFGCSIIIGGMMLIVGAIAILLAVMAVL